MQNTEAQTFAVKMKRVTNLWSTSFTIWLFKSQFPCLGMEEAPTKRGAEHPHFFFLMRIGEFSTLQELGYVWGTTVLFFLVFLRKSSLSKLWLENYLHTESKILILQAYMLQSTYLGFYPKHINKIYWLFGECPTSTSRPNITVLL